MPGLKVVALISGGKDSFFSILHCLANGHEVVALANLHPPLEDGEQSEDIDSFMYQTVGHYNTALRESSGSFALSTGDLGFRSRFEQELRNASSLGEHRASRRD